MRRFTLSALALLVCALPLSAQDAETLASVEHYLDIERVGNPQISPDGQHVIYTRSYVDKMNDRFQSAIWMVDIDGGKHRFLVDGSGPQWSPDGTRIAYLAEGDPDGSQLYVRWMDAEGATSQVTHEPESPRNFMWSPTH